MFSSTSVTFFLASINENCDPCTLHPYALLRLKPNMFKLGGFMKTNNREERPRFFIYFSNFWTISFTMAASGI